MPEAIPKLSVLMAVHNAARHLDETMRSVLGQTFTDFEFVIVEDAPGDETPAILDHHAARDSRIVRLANPAQLGLPTSLNRGLARCRAPLIARIDGDDVCVPDRFAAQIAWLEAHPEAGGCGTWTVEIDDRGEVIGAHQPPGEPGYVRWAMTCHNVVYHPTVMLRRAVLDQVGAYDPKMRYAQDYDLFTRIIAAGFPLGVLETPLLRYRRGGGSITATRQAEQEALGLGARVRYISSLLGRAVEPRIVDVAWRLLAWREVELDDRLTPALRLIGQLREVCARGASAQARQDIDSEISLHLHRRALLALRDHPEAAWHLAGALRPLATMSGKSRRLRFAAVRCMLGRCLRAKLLDRAATSAKRI